MIWDEIKMGDMYMLLEFNMNFKDNVVISGNISCVKLVTDTQ
jgi:hypothetical protein